VSEPLTATEVDRVRQIAETAPDTEIGRLFVRFAALAVGSDEAIAMVRFAHHAHAFSDEHCTPANCLLATLDTRLRRLERVAEAARFHNKTPTGATRACLDGCIACEALADLDAKVEDAG